MPAWEFWLALNQTWDSITSNKIHSFISTDALRRSKWKRKMWRWTYFNVFIQMAENPLPPLCEFFGNNFLVFLFGSALGDGLLGRRFRISSPQLSFHKFLIKALRCRLELRVLQEHDSATENQLSLLFSRKPVQFKVLFVIPSHEFVKHMSYCFVFSLKTSENEMQKKYFSCRLDFIVDKFSVG